MAKESDDRREKAFLSGTGSKPETKLSCNSSFKFCKEHSACLMEVAMYDKKNLRKPKRFELLYHL